MELGVQISETPPKHRDRVLKLLISIGFRLQAGDQASPEELVKAMEADKKRRGGELRFVLQRGVGDTFVRAVDRDDVLKVLFAAARSAPG